LSEPINFLDWPENLPQWPEHLLEQRFCDAYHGAFQSWSEAIRAMPDQAAKNIQLNAFAVTCELSLEDAARENLREQLMHLHPWRKGPFQFDNIFIDTEWRSDWKWQRLRQALDSFSGKRVLDIGCGNGYFGWRMLGDGADEVIGIDPTLLFCMQHQAIQKYFQNKGNWVLPLRLEEIPTTATFDTVLSMGVLYHRRDPQAHTNKVFDLVASGGQGVIETLVVEAKQSLYPKDRYARMRNVWCVPTMGDLATWMSKAGFKSIQTADVSTTSLEEQRSTPWMHFESLAHALHHNDEKLTLEGHPRPVRAMLTGIKP
jgi:tRNA (mo5U34)-methyltransferase